MDDVKCDVENSLVATDKEERKMSKIGKRMMAMLCTVALMVTSLGGVGFVFADEKSVKKPEEVISDYSEIPEKYRDAVWEAVQRGLIKPDAKGRVRPNDYMTLAEYATVHHRLYGGWFTAQDLELWKRVYINFTIDGKDPSQHWAHVPIYYMNSRGLFTFTEVLERFEDGLSSRNNIVSGTPVMEGNLYYFYGIFTITLRRSGSSFMIDESKHDKRFDIMDVFDERIEEMGKIMPKGRNSESDDRHRLYVFGMDGVQFLQSIGLLPLLKDGLEIHLSREITRAEAIYYFIMFNKYLRDIGMENAEEKTAPIGRENMSDLAKGIEIRLRNK